MRKDDSQSLNKDADFDFKKLRRSGAELTRPTIRGAGPRFRRPAGYGGPAADSYGDFMEAV